MSKNSKHKQTNKQTKNKSKILGDIFKFYKGTKTQWLLRIGKHQWPIVKIRCKYEKCFGRVLRKEIGGL